MCFILFSIIHSTRKIPLCIYHVVIAIYSRLQLHNVLSQNWLLSKLLYEITHEKKKANRNNNTLNRKPRGWRRRIIRRRSETNDRTGHIHWIENDEIIEWKIVITNCRFKIAFIAFNNNSYQMNGTKFQWSGHQIRFENVVIHCTFHRVKVSIDSLGLSVALSSRLFRITSSRLYLFIFLANFLFRSFLLCVFRSFFRCCSVVSLNSRLIVVVFDQMIELNRVDISRTYQSYFCKPMNWQEVKENDKEEEEEPTNTFEYVFFFLLLFWFKSTTETN